MNRGDLVREISESEGVPVAVVDQILGAAITHVGDALAGGDEVMIRTFGKFVPRQRAAVVRKNPMTGDEIKVPAKVSVGFVPSGNLKTRLNLNGRGKRRARAQGRT